MQHSEFVDEYMLIYERCMDHEITHEERNDLKEKLIQLVKQRLYSDLYHSSKQIS